jgi:hypothetical protein
MPAVEEETSAGQAGAMAAPPLEAPARTTRGPAPAPSNPWWP